VGPGDQISHLESKARGRLAVEVELDCVAGRRRGVKPINHSGAGHLGDDETVALLTDERVLSGKSVVVAFGAIVAGDGPDEDGTSQLWQLVQPGDRRESQARKRGTRILLLPVKVKWSDGRGQDDDPVGHEYEAAFGRGG